MQVQNRTKTKSLLLPLAIIFLFCHLAFSGRIIVFMGHINFALIFVFLSSYLLFGRALCLAGFFTGLIFDLTTTGPIGLMSFELTLLAFFLTWLKREHLSGDFSSNIKSFLYASVPVLVIYQLIATLSSHGSLLMNLLLATLPSLLLSLVVFALCFLIFRRFAHPQQSKGSPLGSTIGAASRLRQPSRPNYHD